MRKEIIICDKCGEHVTSPFWYAYLTDVEEHTVDICDACMTKFLEPEPVEPAPDPEPKPKKQTRKIDRGKVWSLRDAGWKVSAIAGDMRCSEATIYNIINEGRPE